MEGTFLKPQLRAKIRQQRQSITQASRARWDQAINQAVVQLAEETACHSLSAFLAFDGEPDLRPALDILFQSGLDIALPAIVTTAEGSELNFRRWSPVAQLNKGSFGIHEPAHGEEVRVQDLDLILMPLVGWDARGFRLGMGAGYYDRALSAVAGSTRPQRVGVAYEVQKVAQVPEDPWDIPLHHVITENGRFTCRG